MAKKLERYFQRDLIHELDNRFPGCFIFRPDPCMHQGAPDLIVLYKDKWAALECKRDANSPKRPNQEFRVIQMDQMSFSRFIYPENKEEVLNDLQRTFQPKRKTRVS